MKTATFTITKSQFSLICDFLKKDDWSNDFDASLGHDFLNLSKLLDNETNINNSLRYGLGEDNDFINFKTISNNEMIELEIQYEDKFNDFLQEAIFTKISLICNKTIE